MDLTQSAANKSSPTPTTTPTTTTPETDTETPPTKSTDNFHRPSSSTKLISFTNGSIKPHSHHHQQQLVIRNPSVPLVVVVYRECLKNHAASLGGHALDGCGEFMPSSSATSTDPTSLKCAACGCHRNFHRRDPDHLHLHLHQPGTQIVELHHQHTTTTSSSPRDQSPSPNSVSPPPISSSYNFTSNSAPHMLLALSAGHVSVGPSPPPPLPDHDQHHHQHTTTTATVMTTVTPITKSIMGISTSNGGRKRFRSKFSQEQKDKMYSFSEKMGWKMQKRDESLVEEFCNEIGVGRGVLKVWMHNNKHTFGKSTTTSKSDHHVDHDPLIDDVLHQNNHHHINLHKHHGVTNGSGGSS